MKIISALCLLFCMTTVTHAFEQAGSVYAGAVLAEDVTWHGTILVKGSVVVAPHATLRIDPGTVIRFAATSTEQLPVLVVQGRLHCAGTSERPIIMTSDQSSPERNSWSGVVFLSSDKRNLIEYCRIEYAVTGIDVRFSTVSLKSVSIVKARTALLSHDGVVQTTDSVFSDSITGIELYNSEFDSKNLTVGSCQNGCLLSKSAAVFVSPTIMNIQQTGLESDDCRIKITGGEFSGNGFGARIKSGEGQITMSRFLRNRQTALQLLGSRVKIQRCRFEGNSQDALRTEDGKALLLHNSFISNGGYNLYNSGREDVGAQQNWWGTVEQPKIRQKIFDADHDKNIGAVLIFPWLAENPPLMP